MIPPGWIEGLGYAAATLTTAPFVPQAWLDLRSRDASGLPFAPMGAAAGATESPTASRGLLLGAWPLIAANGVTLLLSTIIPTMKLRLRSTASGDAEPLATNSG